MKLIYLYSLFLKLDFLQIEFKVELNFSKIEFYAIGLYMANVKLDFSHTGASHST